MDYKQPHPAAMKAECLIGLDVADVARLQVRVHGGC